MKQVLKQSHISREIRNSAAYKKYQDAINNPQTAERYEEMFGWYLRYNGATTLDDLLKIPDEKAEDNIIAYIRFLKGDGIRPTTIRTRLAPLILFYEMNRKRLAWKMINKTIPKGNNKSQDRSYSRQEMQMLLSVAKVREQAMITLLASTGMRRGALPSLKRKHLLPLDQYRIYEVVVYGGEAEEYHTYTTPEARAKIDAYFAFREQYGEKLTGESPVFRKDWNLRDSHAGKNPRPITVKTITAVFNDLANRSGTRQRLRVGRLKDSSAGEVGRKAGRVRYAQKIIHGIRKWYEGSLLDAGFNENWLDLLEGHKMKGLRENYYRPRDQTVLLGTTTADGKVHLPGYLDLMAELTISDEERLRGQVSTLKTEAIQKEEDMQRRIEEAVEKKVQQILGKVDVTKLH
jgi:integrase